MISALVAAAICAATPVHVEPLPQSGSLSALPWVQGAPLRHGFFGILFGYDPIFRAKFGLYTRGISRDGSATKVLWVLRNRYAGGWIVINGRELASGARFRQRFREVRDASEHPAVGHEFASIVKLPSAGCWRLNVQSGRAKATFVVQGFDA